MCDDAVHRKRGRPFKCRSVELRPGPPRANALLCGRCPKHVMGECSVTARRVNPALEACDYGKALARAERRERGRNGHRQD